MPPAAPESTAPHLTGEPPDAAANASLVPPLGRIQWQPLAIGALAFALIAAHLATDQGARMAALWVVGGLFGGLFGLTLYQASFGFASGYRQMLVRGDVRGVQAQLLMLAVAVLLFAPVLAAGSAFGRPMSGAWAPVGVSVAAGAFLFGIGMQLAGGCGSGTLFTAGGGSVRMAVVLAAACIGSFAASLHLGFWHGLPSLAPMVPGRTMGWPLATALQLAVIGGLWWAAGRFAAARGTAAVSSSSVPTPNGAPASLVTPMHWLRGPWPLALAALLLALGNVATLLLDGQPWSIMWGLTLWGAKAAMLGGWSPESSSFWRDGGQRAALDGGLLEDSTSLMDLAIMLGALVASALAARFAPQWRVPRASLAAALLGGLAIGYGARIAYGCNIGAFFSGVASGSLHGWLWIGAALPGTWLGIGIRRRFGLAD